ncbi:hypothetical protein ACE5IS_19830 [Leptospira wolffii]|uniref:Uncharacterized protein n=1 Tax=Leptospira wolffii TaxID=409998 RepID=A0ABV5BRD1_9LEPT
MRAITFIVLIVFSSFRCKEYVFLKHVSGKIHLVAVDSLEQMTLSYLLPEGTYVGIIGETIEWVGFEPHSDRILIKQKIRNEHQEVQYFSIDAQIDYSFGYRDDGIHNMKEKEFFEMIQRFRKRGHTLIQIYSAQ